MKQSIGTVALVIRDYDEAIAFYVDILGFILVEDTFIEAQNKRWVVVAPPGSTGSRLLLARAVGEEQSSRIGNQTGGRVFLFLDYGSYRKKESSSSASRERRATEPSRCSGTCTAIYAICCRSSDAPRTAFTRRGELPDGGGEHAGGDGEEGHAVADH
jgi:catechol 2,3-dioxygenase-like lactoylglutathione lyase family enzyme